MDYVLILSYIASRPHTSLCFPVQCLVICATRRGANIDCREIAIWVKVGRPRFVPKALYRIPLGCRALQCCSLRVPITTRCLSSQRSSAWYFFLFLLIIGVHWYIQPQFAHCRPRCIVTNAWFVPSETLTLIFSPRSRAHQLVSTKNSAKAEPRKHVCEHLNNFAHSGPGLC